MGPQCAANCLASSDSKALKTGLFQLEVYDRPILRGLSPHEGLKGTAVFPFGVFFLGCYIGNKNFLPLNPHTSSGLPNHVPSYLFFPWIYTYKQSFKF